MKIKSTFLILILINFSCKKETENKKETLSKKSDINRKITIDKIYKLLAKSSEIDTLEFINQDPFLFIKTGNLFSNKDKSAIIVNCPTDTTYTIQLYTKIEKKWIKNDEINNLEVPYRRYEVLTMDYNFDGFIDIYLNSNSSNGWCLSSGNLLIVNPLTRKFEKHIETKNLQNMFPDKKTKTILTDSVEYNQNGKRIWNLVYKWNHGKLEKTKQKIRNEKIF